MRAHTEDHAGSLPVPVLDVAALKHGAYVLDALIYYMRTCCAGDSCLPRRRRFGATCWSDIDEQDVEEMDSVPPLLSTLQQSSPMDVDPVPPMSLLTGPAEEDGAPPPSGLPQHRTPPGTPTQLLQGQSASSRSV
ncbi:unnamed protein product, partial [Cyprideis torosa]